MQFTWTKTDKNLGHRRRLVSAGCCNCISFLCFVKMYYEPKLNCCHPSVFTWQCDSLCHVDAIRERLVLFHVAAKGWISVQIKSMIWKAKS